MKRVLQFLFIVTLIIIVLLSWLITTEKGLRWGYQHAEFYLPNEINIDKLEGRLIGPITISGFQLQQETTLINAEKIIIDWQPLALLTTKIHITTFDIEALEIILPKSDDDPAVKTDTQGIILPEVKLPWLVEIENTKIENIKIQQGDQLIPLDEINFQVATSFNKINIKALNINSEKFKIKIKGKLNPGKNYKHNLDINWQAKLANNTLLHGSGQLTGNTKTTKLKQLLTGPLRLTLDLQLNDLLNKLNWLAKIDARQFDLTQLDSHLPALSGTMKLDAKGDLNTAVLTGRLQGEYPDLGKFDADFDLQRLIDNSFQINKLNVQVPQNNTDLKAKGLWTPGSNGGDIKLSLNWNNLSWPMQDTAWFDSPRGKATVEGTLDNYKITIDTNSTWPAWPKAPGSNLTARATGNLQGINISSLLINTLNGEAEVNGQVNWSPQINWQLDGRVNNIDPATFWPEWPGQLQGKITSSGQMKNDQLTVKADISQLNGTLRSYPVSLRSHLAWRDNHLDISQLNFSSGKSQLYIDGQLGETLNLNWSINSQNLLELYPQISGELKVQGELKGAPEKPFVTASVTGKSLRYTDYEIADIDAEIAVDLEHWQQIDINLTANELKLKDYKLQSLLINTNKSDITIQLVDSKATMHVELTGEADETGWRGTIKKADILSEHFSNWQLDSPGKLSLTDKLILLNDSCWHSEQQANLCASIKHENATLLSSLTMNNFPLKIFEPWLPPDLILESIANGKAEVEFKSPETLLAQVEILLPTGSISYPMLSGENNHREYHDGKINLALDHQGLKASSEINMANGDLFSGQLTLPGMKPLAGIDPEQPLKASTRFIIRDMKLIEALVPEIYDLRGELKLKFDATGTLEKPILLGSANISDGSLQLPGLGLNINNITFNGQSVNSNRFNFRLDANSGDGKLDIIGHTLLDDSAGWPTEINIKGDQFEVSRIPEARVVITPNLKVTLNDHVIDINGEVHIPYAKLQPKDLTQASTISNDTVIIDSKQTTEEKWLINTSVRLILGERVHLYGFGFEGRLGGNILLEDEPGQLTKATGEITVPEGTYRAYGQRLQIENGRLLYTGGPLTNPGLDLRAVRIVDNVTAGIYVKGSLDQPKLEIFSNPAMGETDALAYILLGRPIENTTNEDGAMMTKAALALGLSGGDSIARSLGDRFGLDDLRVESSDKGDQAALVVGRYLSPRLYASYGVGLIDNINILTLRYKIAKKWHIKVESGGDQSADILYTFER